MGSAAPSSSDKAASKKRRAPSSASPATEESTKPGKKRAVAAPAMEQTAENGVILKIVVENFMNHAHMQIDLDPHVNFIVGKNGSGKSAIVASCIAGLGCKAATTGRNLSSYKHFIKHGTDYALVQIHLANGGHDPYCHDEFGDVVRRARKHCPRLAHSLTALGARCVAGRRRASHREDRGRRLPAQERRRPRRPQGDEARGGGAQPALQRPGGQPVLAAHAGGREEVPAQRQRGGPLPVLLGRGQPGHAEAGPDELPGAWH